jgi:hypothetical protein
MWRSFAAKLCRHARAPPPLQVSEELASAVHDSYILKHVTGSDHVPLGIVIKRG